MAKRKSSRRRKRGGSPAFIFLVFVAIVAGALLYPLTHAQRRSAARVAAPEAPMATEFPAHPVRPELPPKVRVPTPAPLPSAAPSAAASASPAVPVSGEHRLAIIIDDCGQWPKTERALIALPVAITMSVMPKERYTQAIAQEADAAGKGVMLHLPMEPMNGMDPGPGKVTTAMSDAAIAAQVDEDVAAVPLAKGVNNHEGSKASSDPRVMKDVVAALAPKGLFFIDSRTSAQSVAQSVAAGAGMRTAARDVFLDNVDDVTAIEARLREAADDAEKNGSAIAIGHPRGATLEAIAALIPELQKRGITFVKASDLVR
jgi:hypothetical protein